MRLGPRARTESCTSCGTQLSYKAPVTRTREAEKTNLSSQGSQVGGSVSATVRSTRRACMYSCMHACVRASLPSLSVALHDIHDVVNGHVLSNQHFAIVDLVLGQDPLHLRQKSKDQGQGQAKGRARAASAETGNRNARYGPRRRNVHQKHVFDGKPDVLGRLSASQNQLDKSYGETKAANRASPTVAAGSSPRRVNATVLLNFTPPSFFSLPGEAKR